MKQSSTKIKELHTVEFYQDFYNMDLEQFRARCIEIINSARAPNFTLIEQLKKMSSKKSLLESVNNFIFKGHGFGVVK